MSIFHSKTKWLFATMMLIANHILGQNMTSCGSTTINQPTRRYQSVTFHNGSLYISESNPSTVAMGTVFRIVPGTGAILATSNNQLDFPTGVAVHPTSGRVYVNQRGFANPANNNIQIYNNNLGTPIASLQASGVNEMSDALLIDDRGRLFVNIITNIGGIVTGQIRVYDINGTTPTLININGSNNFFTTNRYHSMAFRRINPNTIQLYATNFGNNTVSIFTITDNNIMTNERTFPTNNGGNNTAGITVTNDGFIHVGTGGLTNHSIRTFCEDGTLVNTLPVLVQANGRLNGLTRDGNTIYIAEDIDAFATNQRIFCYNFVPPQFQLSVSTRNIYCSNESFITLNLNLLPCSLTNSYTVEIYQNNILINTVSPTVINNTTLQIPMLASGIYQVRVIGANPTVTSSFSNIFSVSPSYQATLNGNVTTTIGNSIDIPVNIIGTTPSPSNPIGITLIRTDMSGASVSIPVNITSVPFVYTDNTISSIGTYTYTIQNTGSSCSTNSGNFIATVTDIAPCTTGDLWGKDTSFDTGDESVSCNNGAPAWQSPDIWLSPSASAYNDDTDRAPIPGTTNYVYVRVRNRGNNADTGKLRLYWAAASTGLYWSNSWTGLDQCSGIPLGGEILGNVVDENGNIVTNNDINHMPNQTRIYRFAWVVPNPNDYVNCFFNGLPIDRHHFCLLARIEQDATNCRPAQPANETTSTYLNATCNNNIFWQNVMIIEKDAKGGFSSGVGVKGRCILNNVPKTTEVSVINPEFIGCKPSRTKLTWMSVMENKEYPINFWDFGQLFIQIDNVAYNNWLNSGAQGTGILDMSGGLFQILEPNASMFFDLSNGQSIGINHYFIPLTRKCVNVDVDLKQENCIISTGTCSIIGGERFSLRGFCTPNNTGFEPQRQSNIVNVYPSPAQDNLTIEFTEEQKEISFYITDSQGRIIKEKAFFNNSQKVNVNVAKIPSGIYLIHIQNGKGETSVQRFVRQ
jgi:hypothetical protein